jgi:hypothetical protein
MDVSSAFSPPLVACLLTAADRPQLLALLVRMAAAHHAGALQAFLHPLVRESWAARVERRRLQLEGPEAPGAVWERRKERVLDMLRHLVGVANVRLGDILPRLAPLTNHGSVTSRVAFQAIQAALPAEGESPTGIISLMVDQQKRLLPKVRSFKGGP